jgi:eukaryotic-like serine/threonine-protein kinase
MFSKDIPALDRLMLILLLVSLDVLLLLSVFTISLPALAQTKQENFLTYENHIFGVKIRYPPDWTIDEKNITPNNNGIATIVGFVKDFKSFSGDFLISIYNLTANSNAHVITLDKLLDNIIDSYKKYIYTDFNLVESNTTHLAGNNNPAYKLVWIDPEGQYTIKTMQIGTIIGHKLYVVQYYAELEKYSDNLPAIQKMIDSLQINYTTQKNVQ